MACSLITALVLGSITASGEAGNDALLEMDLQQLMNVEVVAVSRKKDKITDAPGIVTVIDARQIRELGARSLNEVLLTVPGLFGFTNYFSVVDQLSIRGDLSDNTSNKILFTINGHPSYASQDGALYTDMMPIDAIERVEIVRGPVSVLYGTNALTGMINIVTKKDLSENRGSLALQAGSFGTREGKITLAEHAGDWRVLAALAIKKQSGYDMAIAADQDMLLGQSGVRRQFEQHQQLFLQAARGNLEIDLLYMNQDRSAKYGILPTLLFPMVQPFNIENYGIDIRYRQALSERHELNYTLRYDRFYNDYAVGNYQILQNDPTAPHRVGVGAWQDNKYGVEVFLNSQFDWGDLTTGALWDEYRGDAVLFETGVSDPFVLIPTPSENRDAAVYSNARFVWNERASLVGGLRYTDNKITGDHLDYRLGAVWQLPGQFTLKTLYGTSYRSPTFEELYEDAPPVIRGNQALRFEELSGVDISLSHGGKHHQLSLNYFRNETADAIATQPATDGVPTYTNISGIKTDGFEWDFNWSPDARLKTFFRGSLLLHVTDVLTGASLKNDTVSRMYALGFDWQASSTIQLTSSYLYNGKWLTSPSFGLLNAAVYYRPHGGKVEWYVLLHNALNKNYTYPEWQNRVIDTIPGGPPRSLLAGVRIDW